jgi:hypothetical protein
MRGRKDYLRKNQEFFSTHAVTPCDVVKDGMITVIALKGE